MAHSENSQNKTRYGDRQTDEKGHDYHRGKYADNAQDKACNSWTVCLRSSYKLKASVLRYRLVNFRWRRYGRIWLLWSISRLLWKTYRRLGWWILSTVR